MKVMLEQKMFRMYGYTNVNYCLFFLIKLFPYFFCCWLDYVLGLITIFFYNSKHILLIINICK